MPESPPAPIIRPALPLQGVTLLAVEDSRYACEALRLIARRLGARLRRAERLAEARRHLALYRPDAVLVDLGLPDGSGVDLIGDLALRGAAAPVAIAISGDPDGRGAALAAGAAAFVEKPLAGTAAFGELLVALLGRRGGQRSGQGGGQDSGHSGGQDIGPADGDAATAWPEPGAPPDPLALRDDLERAAALLAQAPDAAGRTYLARFLAGIARSACDAALAEAAGRLSGDAAAAGALAALLAARLAAAPAAFAPRP
jgi:CheY-like chemotaxis protein